MAEKVVIGNAELWHGDCREVLPLLPQADCVLTDPPYSQATHDGARGKGATTGGGHKLVDFEHLTEAEYPELLALVAGKAKRWTLAFSDWTLAYIARAAGLPLIRLGVWTKTDPAPQFTGDRPGTGWESILILHPEGRKRWNGGGRPAVWRTGIEKNGNVHPTQKPVQLMAALLADFTDAGESVLDPFMGSGTTGVACAMHGRAFIGIERERRYFDIACERISRAQAQGTLLPPEPPRECVQEGLL